MSKISVDKSFLDNPRTAQYKDGEIGVYRHFGKELLVTQLTLEELQAGKG